MGLIMQDFHGATLPYLGHHKSTSYHRLISKKHLQCNCSCIDKYSDGKRPGIIL